MKNHLIYFILLSVIFLIEFAFNLNFYVTYKSDVCITQVVNDSYTGASPIPEPQEPKQTDKIYELVNGQFCKTADTIPPDCGYEKDYQIYILAKKAYDDGRVYNVTGTSSTVYPLSIGLLQFFNFIFCLIIVGLFGKFDQAISFKWASYGFMDTCFGRCFKCLPCFIKFINYLAFIVLVVYTTSYISGDCKTAIHYTVKSNNDGTNSINPDEGKMYKGSQTIILVDYALFLIIIYIFGYAKRRIYWPNYMYEPIKDQSKIVTSLFHTYGP